MGLLLQSHGQRELGQGCSARIKGESGAWGVLPGLNEAQEMSETM